MIWSASLLLAAGAALAADSTVPVELEWRVREAVAELWAVEAETVRLEWGRVAGADPIAADASFRLAGRSPDGRFVVVFSGEHGRRAVGMRAGREAAVWVVKAPLSVGAEIGPTDVAASSALVWGPPSSEEESPVGWQVRRALGVGDRITAQAVIEPAVIHAGERVRFEWRLGAMLVAREGVASAPARRGERVTARDPVRGETLRGVALGPGRARLEGERR
ncbi:MAG: flagella basal body P-ring formation protein FlgA [Gemmatimonadales bacterium]